MAWVEVELDERTFRALRSQAERSGLSVPEVLRRLAAKEAAVSERRRTAGTPAGSRVPAGGAMMMAASGGSEEV